MTTSSNYASLPNIQKKNHQPILLMDRKKKQIIIRDVMLLQGVSNYTYFHMKCGKIILLTKTMKKYCELFEQHDFVRVNKSFLINLNYLKEIDKTGELTVVMQSGKRIEVSRRRKSLFHLKFSAFKI